jgi:simple sugar transport system permease protein
VLALPPAPGRGAAGGIFGVLVIWLNTNQYATGLALSLFGAGFSAFVGIGFVQAPERAPKFAMPCLADIPFIGPALFRSIRWSTAPCCWRRPGLVPLPLARRPGAARGGRVARVGPCAGLPGAAHPPGGGDGRRRAVRLAGAYLSVIYTPLWVEGMVAGRGWIALALTTFATWRPARVLLGAYLFGGVTMLQFHLQGEGVQVPSQCCRCCPTWPPSWCWC